MSIVLGSVTQYQGAMGDVLVFPLHNATAIMTRDPGRVESFTYAVNASYPYDRWGLSRGPIKDAGITAILRVLAPEDSTDPYTDLETMLAAMHTLLEKVDATTGVSNYVGVLTAMTADSAGTKSARVRLTHPPIKIEPNGNTVNFMDLEFHFTMLEDFA